MDTLYGTLVVDTNNSIPILSLFLIVLILAEHISRNFHPLHVEGERIFFSVRKRKTTGNLHHQQLNSSHSQLFI